MRNCMAISWSFEIAWQFPGKIFMFSLIAKLRINYEDHVVCFSNFCLENCISWDTNWKVPLSYMATAMAVAMAMGLKIMQKTVYETAKGINLLPGAIF